MENGNKNLGVRLNNMLDKHFGEMQNPLFHGTISDTQFPTLLLIHFNVFIEGQTRKSPGFVSYFIDNVVQEKLVINRFLFLALKEEFIKYIQGALVMCIACSSI